MKAVPGRKNCDAWPADVVEEVAQALAEACWAEWMKESLYGQSRQGIQPYGVQQGEITDARMGQEGWQKSERN